MSKKNISSSLKASVWNYYIGEEYGISKCFCCNLSTITKDNFDCGHVVAESKGGETKLNNLRPICGKCNSSMSIKNMEEFMENTGYDKNKNWNGICNNNFEEIKKKELDKIKKKKEKLKEISKELEEKELELEKREIDVKKNEDIIRNMMNYMEKKMNEIKKDEKDIKINFLFSKIEECKIENRQIDNLKYFSILKEIINKVNNFDEIKKLVDDKKIKLNINDNLQIIHTNANRIFEAIQQICEIFKIKFYIKIKLINNETYEWKKN